MKPPVRDQVSVYENRIKSPLVCPADEDMTRQEFKAESDTESVLRRAGGNMFARRAVYGVQDFDTDLQTIKNAVIRAVDGVKTLPEALQAKYATQAALLQGLAAGELFLTQDGLKAAADVVPQSGATADAASQAEGAAGSGNVT